MKRHGAHARLTGAGPRVSFWGALLACLGLLAGTALAHATPAPDSAPPLPRVTYTRSFQGSTPAFLEIAVGANGAARFLERDKAGEPAVTLDFTLAPPEAKAVFAFAAELHDFAQPKLQSKAKVAYTGEKMLAYDDTAGHHDQTFTYTTLPAAARLVVYFEQAGASGMYVVQLRRAIRYQPLSVLEIMERLQADWHNHQLAAPGLLEPLLDQMAADSALMGAVRRRAATLALAMREKPEVGARLAP